MPITPSQSPPHTGAVTVVLELLSFLRDPGFAGPRFAEMGDVLKLCSPVSHSRLSSAGEA